MTPSREQGATDVGVRTPSRADAVDLAAGTLVGHYRIDGVLGRGGMGIVYRAVDTKLDRPVAIKFVSAAAAAPDVRRRFEQEARTTSSLNHPHIVTVYDVGEHDGRQYIVSELVDGGTLDEWSTKTRRRSWRQSVEILTGVADALAAAHSAGVLHRDVKPGNILIGSNGYAKLADFGLAKLVGADARAAADPSHRASLDTRAGVVVGTVAYMSPEQAAGQPLDARSDVFSFGIVLYELVAGRRPFDSANELEVLKAIAHAAPDPLPAETPELLRMVVDKALEKEPGDRHQTMQDLVADLKRVSRRAMSSAVAAASSGASRGSRLPWLVAAAGVLALVAAVPVALFWRETPLAPPLMQFDIVAPGYVAGSLAISPDSRQLAYTAATAAGVPAILTRSIDAREARPLQASEGATGAFWSPDSRSLAFSGRGGLRRVNVSGGGPQVLAELAPPLAGAWTGDGTVLLSAPVGVTGLAINRVPAAGGALAVLTEPDIARSELGHVLPRLLPDGEHFIYLATQPSLTTAIVQLDSLAGGPSRPLFTIEEIGTLGRANRTLNLAYAHGHILYFRDNSVMAQPFDADSLEVQGEPRTLLESVSEFAVADDLLAYREAASTPSGQPRRLVWYDRAGTRLGEIEAPAPYRFPVLSRDARYLAVAAPPPGVVFDDLYAIDTALGNTRRLTFSEGVELGAVWSADDERIVYASSRGASSLNQIFERDASGAGVEKRLFEAPDGEVVAPHDWTTDGRYVLLNRLTGNRTSYWVLPLVDGEPPYQLLEFSSPLGPGRLSPDGRWLAYAINESNGFQIVVQPFPNVGDGKWQVSARGGYNPRWRDDGRELYYLEPDGTLVAVDVSAAGRAFEWGTPRALFGTQARYPAGITDFVEYLFDPAPRGERFLVNETPATSASGPSPAIHMIVNWSALLDE